MMELLKNYNAISIMGTGKSVGKTYTLNYILSRMVSGECIGLTSIGLEGNKGDRSEIAGKPSIYVKKGTCIAAAEKCVLNSDVTREILDVTGINTPLGKIVLFRALSDGYVEMGGPSICSDLSEVHSMLVDAGCDRILVDGAMNRKTQSMPEIMDAIVLCTGASISPDMDKVIETTAYYVNILSIQKEEDKNVLKLVSELMKTTRVAFIHADYSYRSFNLSSSLNIGNEVLESIGERPVWLMIKGVVSKELLQNIMKSFNDLTGITVLAEDGTKIFADTETLQRFEKKGGTVKVINSVKVVCISANPYSPEGYCFDSRLFIDSLRNRLNIPIFDLKEGS